MVEVLIAGILLASVLAAVSRLSVAALVGSSSLAERTRIEGAINDDIQTMQKEDSYYSDEWIIDNGGQDALKIACTNPPEALKNHLQTVAPNLSTASVTRTFDVSTIPGLLRIIYVFDGPEQQVNAEKRIIEMSPNFAAKCYST